MDLEYIKKNYSQFDDSKIEDLAKYQARSLRKEVLPILIEEIKKRNLSESLISGIQSQLKEPTLEELNQYTALINTLPCPKCGSKTQKLNGVVLREVVSFLVITTTRVHSKIACPDCLDTFKNQANSKTILLGWWSPLGVIRTIQALTNNGKMSTEIGMNEPNDILKSFVYENLGAIETHKDNSAKLTNIIDVFNAKII